MADPDEGSNRKPPQPRWRDENPSSRPLKLALLAAAIICIIAILVYLKARHHPPALHDMLQGQPAGKSALGSLHADLHLISPSQP